MTINTRFGALLRAYRQQAKHPSRGGSLSQEQLGALIGQTCGTTAYSGAAISDWERSRSHIHKDDRKLLMSIITVLYQNGGLNSLEEANTLLLSGNYRPLNSPEVQQIFKIAPQKPVQEPLTNSKIFVSLLAKSFIPVIKPPTRPGWSAAFLGILGQVGDWFTPEKFLRIIAWVLVWWFATKTLTFPFNLSRIESPNPDILLYNLGAFLIPWFVGILTSTRNDSFWIDQQLNRDSQVRAYTYLGASMGFHVGYMLFFFCTLIIYYSTGNGFSNSINQFISLLALMLASASAREVPFNQWRAFGQVRILDGMILFIFLLYPFIFSVFWFISQDILLNRLLGSICLITSLVLIAVKAILERKPQYQHREIQK